MCSQAYVLFPVHCVFLQYYWSTIYNTLQCNIILYTRIVNK